MGNRGQALLARSSDPDLTLYLKHMGLEHPRTLNEHFTARLLRVALRQVLRDPHLTGC